MPAYKGIGHRLVRRGGLLRTGILLVLVYSAGSHSAVLAAAPDPADQPVVQSQEVAPEPEADVDVDAEGGLAPAAPLVEPQAVPDQTADPAPPAPRVVPSLPQVDPAPAPPGVITPPRIEPAPVPRVVDPAPRVNPGTGPAMVDRRDPHRVVDELPPGPSLPNKGDLGF